MGYRIRNSLKLPDFKRILVAAVAILVLPGCSPVEQSPPPVSEAPVAPRADLVIEGGALIDMVADDPERREIKALVIRDGKIDQIIAADSGAAIPDAVQTIDASTGFILPGFIDSHVHFRPFVPDASIWKRASNYYGITTLFDTGPCGGRCSETGQDPNEWIVAYKAFMNSSPVADGPTLYMTGRRIQPLDGTHPLGMKFSTREEIADYLDTLVALGSDGVKAESTLPPDLRAAVIEEATARGLPVVGHSRDAIESIDTGMTFIEHMWPITSSIAMSDPGEKFVSPKHDYLLDLDKAPGLIETMVGKGVYVNPTMVGRYGYFADSMRGEADVDERSFAFGGLYSDLPANSKQEVRDWWQRASDWDAATLASHREGLGKVEQFLTLFSDAGGKILPATDSGEDKLVGIGLHREFSMLGDAGVSPYRILLGATRWPAEMMRKADRIGTLEVGKLADLVIFGSDPTTDIGNSRDIRYVVKAGTVVRRADDCSIITPPMAITCSN